MRVNSLGEGLMFTDITGGEIYLVKRSSDDFDQPVSQSPSFSVLLHAIAKKIDLTDEDLFYRLSRSVHQSLHLHTTESQIMHR